jgi:negative regulator of flagellin synthesis FlgM
MKITTQLPMPQVPVSTETVAVKDTKKHHPGGHRPPVAAPPDESAQVLLSAEAKQLGGIKDETGFDTKKVERIATAIRAGTFKVNPEAIADKLISNATELLARKPN